MISAQHLSPQTSTRRIAAAAFLISALLLVGGGYWYYRLALVEIIKEKHQELSAVGELKAKQIFQWQTERQWDAYRLSNDLFSRKAVEAFLRERGNETLRADLRGLLKLEEQSSEAEDVLLLASDGTILLAASDNPQPTSPVLQKAIAVTLAQGKVVISDFYHGQNGEIYVDVVETMRNAAGQPMAAVVFRINAQTYLYPLIQSWPTPSLSAETLLVQRSGSEVVYLSDLRNHPHTALALHEPLSHIKNPSVQVALGKRGIFEGKDNQGIPVLSDLRPIPYSPWLIVAKVDSKEIFAEAHYRAIAITLVIGLCILLIASALAYYSRKRQIKILQNLFVSERKLAEAQTKQIAAQQLLADEQNQLRTLVDLLPAAVYVKDRESRFLLANNTCAKFMGAASQQELIGKTDADFYPASAAADFLRDEQEVLNGTPLLCKDQNSGTPDAPHFLLTTKVPLRAWDGSIIGLVGVSHDISERKAIEEKLQAALADLEHSNKELEQFTYAVSHDLKAPLVTINSFLGYLKEDLQANHSEAVDEDLGYIHSAADKMGNLLGELLELARGGRRLEQAAEVPLQEIAHEALMLLAGQIAERQVQVDVTCEPIILYGDRSRLVAIFQNLVDNAVKFLGDQPHPRVEIGIEHGDEIVIFVRDNGKGISPQNQAKVFSMFCKFEASTNGSGIGLALVRSIVEAHGGKIWVQSDGLGLGTTFLFTLAKTRIG